jgi:hypothetical protein
MENITNDVLQAKQIGEALVDLPRFCPWCGNENRRIQRTDPPFFNPVDGVPFEDAVCDSVECAQKKAAFFEEAERRVREQFGEQLPVAGN